MADKKYLMTLGAESGTADLLTEQKALHLLYGQQIYELEATKEKIAQWWAKVRNVLKEKGILDDEQTVININEHDQLHGARVELSPTPTAAELDAAIIKLQEMKAAAEEKKNEPT